MPHTRRTTAALLAGLLALGLFAGPTSAAPRRPEAPTLEPSSDLWNGQIQFQLIASGLSSPLGVVNAGDGSNRLFVLERQGTVRVIANRQLLGGNFLDLRGGVPGGIASGGEQGLLGMAFHPSFETNRKLFVYYTNSAGNIIIAQLTANAEGTAVNLATWDAVLEIPHPTNSNHNGGQLVFGPDGGLYAFVGDGGGGGDPSDNAQDNGSPLGKILRLEPDLNGGFNNLSTWAKGLRNPWRASFDRATGDLWIGDVGQENWEEINRAVGNPSGVNYGWDCREGLHPYGDPSPSEPCPGGYTDPVAEYATASPNCSVTGGYVYRGAIYGHFQGEYIYGDFCSGNVWTLDAASPGSPQHHHDTAAMITSFGEAEDGEIYMTDFSGGHIWKVVAPTFNDVLASPFIDDITWIHYRQITTGCGSGQYCPTLIVNREQMASFLGRAFNLPPGDRDYFWDDNGTPHEADINRVARAGITLGCGDGRYCPHTSVTRAEMASFLARARNLPPPSRDWFWDDNGSPHEADINRVADARITLGCGGGAYCPHDTVTREQMAAFLRRALTP